MPGFSKSSAEISCALTKGVNFGVLNIRSIYHKSAFLLSFIIENNISIMCITETWLTDNHRTAELFLSGFKVHRLDRGKKIGGGVATIVSNQYDSNMENVSISDNLEMIHVSVKAAFNTIHFLNIYRPPSGSLDYFVDYLSSFLQLIDSCSKNLVILGDFNVDFNLASQSSNRLRRLFSNNGYKLYKTGSTRITATTNTCIDALFTSNNLIKKINSVKVVPIGFSDHCAITACIKKERNVTYPTTTIKVHDINVNNVANFRSSLDMVNYRHADVNDTTNSLIESSLVLIAEKFPLKNKQIIVDKHERVPWITPFVDRCCKKRDDSLAAALNSGTQRAVTHYRTTRNQCNLAVRQAKREHFKKEIISSSRDTKKTWGVINSFLKGTKSSDNITLHINNRTITNPLEVADICNNYFIKAVNDIVCSFTGVYIEGGRPSVGSCFAFNQVSESQCAPIFYRLYTKGSGPDSISSRFLKFHPMFYVSAMTDITNQSFSCSTFPSRFKIAHVKPDPKKGDLHLVKNYRPVSGLPNLSKILERVAYDQLMEYLINNNLLFSGQHGFRRGHSTSTATIVLLNYIYDALDRNKMVCVTFLDQSKAFDVIDHNILLRKLRYQFNFSSDALSWILSYLTGRKQCVVLNGVRSPYLDVLHGVPQGSILGPLLFLCYINDIHYSVKNGGCVIYADDTTVVTIADDLISLRSKAVDDLNRIAMYCENNHLMLNVGKSAAMVFSRRSIDSSNFEININGTHIPIVQEFRYLGFIIDSNLTFRKHSDLVSGKLTSVNSVIRRLRCFLPNDILLTIFNSLGMCHINYCSTVLSDYRLTTFNIMDTCYRRCGKTIYNCATSVALADINNWYDIRHIFLFNRLLLIYKIIYKGYCPCLRVCLMDRNIDYNLRRQGRFTRQHVNKKSTMKAFAAWAPKLWNQIPKQLAECSSIALFKHRLHDWLIISTGDILM